MALKIKEKFKQGIAEKVFQLSSMFQLQSLSFKRKCIVIIISCLHDDLLTLPAQSFCHYVRIISLLLFTHNLLVIIHA